MTLPDFNEEEFEFLANAELMVSKRVIQDKIFKLLELTKESLESIIDPSQTHLFPTAKISRGENYQSLPYLILDYPATFSLEDILACRTMFLWGKFFSVTVHLQGKPLQNNRPQLAEIVGRLSSENLFVSAGNTPWQYHYGRDNYVPLRGRALKDALNNKFIKISKRIPLCEFKTLPDQGRRFYEPFLKNLSLTN